MRGSNQGLHHLFMGRSYQLLSTSTWTVVISWQRQRRRPAQRFAWTPRGSRSSVAGEVFPSGPQLRNEIWLTPASQRDLQDYTRHSTNSSPPEKCEKTCDRTSFIWQSLIDNNSYLLQCYIWCIQYYCYCCYHLTLQVQMWQKSLLSKKTRQFDNTDLVSLKVD